jgi:type I restriction enzyme S subunit
MEWPKRKLGDLADVTRGSSPRPIVDTRYFEGGTIPWVKIADATKSGKYLLKTKECVNEFGASFSRRLPPGTILVAASGTLGCTIILGVEACAHDGWLILQNLKGLDRDFAYYALKTLGQHFVNSAYGAAIQNINTDILRQSEIPLPPLPIQRRIASILSAHDDLIANNHRRIRILEAVARAAYKEWFADVLFSDRTGDTFFDLDLGKVPAKWQSGVLVDFLSVIETGNRPKGGVAAFSEGVPSIGAESIIGAGRFDFNKTKYVPREYFSGMKRGILEDRDVLVYKDGGQPGIFTPHVTIFGSGFPFREMAINSHVYRLRTKGDISQEYLFFYLSSEPVLHWMHMNGSGAAIPGLARKDLMRLPFAVPEKQLLQRFAQFSKPLVSQIFSLARAAETLRQSRDLLLPRLLSGQVELAEREVTA